MSYSWDMPIILSCPADAVEADAGVFTHTQAAGSGGGLFKFCFNLISEQVKSVFYNGIVHWEDAFWFGMVICKTNISGSREIR